jgi:hypothetical protein
MGWVIKATPRPLYPWEKFNTHYIGNLLGPRTGLDGCGKSPLHKDPEIKILSPKFQSQL